MAKQQSKKDAKINLTALENEAAPQELASVAPIETQISRSERYYNASGHIIDAGLQTEYDDEKKQGILFPDIIKGQFKQISAEVLPEKAGFDYSESEFLLKHTLMQILWETRSSDGKTFGNQPSLKDGRPVIAIGAYELAQRRYDRSKISGQDLHDLQKTIEQLRKRTFWVQRTFLQDETTDKRKKRQKKTQRRLTTWEAIQLFSLHIGQEDDDSSAVQPSLNTPGKSRKFVFQFDKIFIQDMAAWYVRFPIGWLENIRKTCGDHAGIKPYRMAELLFELHAYKRRNKRQYQEIDRDRLLYKIGMQDELKAGRRGRIDKKLENYFDVFSHEPLQLLERVEKLKGAKGQEKFRFYLNDSYFPEQIEAVQQEEEGGGA